MHFDQEEDVLLLLLLDLQKPLLLCWV